MIRAPRLLLPLALVLAAPLAFSQDRPLTFDPSSEPAVLAVARVQPAVVNINTERVVRTQVQDPFDSFISEFFGQSPGGGGGPRTEQRKQRSLGSGFVVDPEGYIITNEHVVERAADLKISVSFPDGSTYDAKYIGGDRQFDLALIKIEKKGSKPFPFIELSKPSPNYLGQTVLALGNPLGYKSSVSRGILSAKDREITVEDVKYKKLLQTDAAINPGNSGGPLIDLAGQLCGVNSVRLAFTPDRAPVQGIGFAIPAEVVAEKFALFRQQARSPRTADAGRSGGDVNPAAINEAFSKIPWEGGLKGRTPSASTPNMPTVTKLFGMTLQALTEDLAAAFGIKREGGVLISDTEPGSPAREAGLRKGLVIYQVGRNIVSTPEDVEKLIHDVKPGTEVDFVVGTSGRRLPFGLGSTGAEKKTLALTAR